MFPPWRFKLREAQVAFKQGRLEEAAAICAAPQLAQYLPVRQLAALVAEQLARRALERAAAGDFASGWRDLDQARQLAGETDHWQRLQQAVAEVAVSDVVQHLAASDYAGAASRLDALERRKMPGVSLQTLREVAKRLQSAHHLAQRSRFAEAAEQIAAAAALRPDLELIGQKRQQIKERAERARLLQEQLHAAIAAGDWTKVLAWANELIEIAPENRVARDARKRAWAEVGQKVGDSRHLAETEYWNGPGGSRWALAERALSAAGLMEPACRSGPRLMLWIDGVGGYLVCLGDDVVLGQASPTSKTDVPILADISRQHAVISRRGEGYLLQPLAGQVSLVGKPLAEPALLSDGDEFTLGDAVKLRFRKPHVLSASARLEMISPHRTHPSADAVILMAESCVLGPKWQNHVVCRDWAGDVVLYRSDDKLMCRAMESIEIDGRLHDGRGPVRPGSHVVGTDFSLSLESA